MFVEVIELLRCTGSHEESWLVASADRTDGRSIVNGELGCPICDARFPISNGIADFRSDRSAKIPLDTAPIGDDAELAMRLGAMLGLMAPGGAVVLEGAWTRGAFPLSDLVNAHYLLVNPAPDIELFEPLGAVMADDRLPIRSGVARGVALVESSRFASDANRVLTAGGRLVAPLSAPIPGELRELATDDRWRVLERVGPPIVHGIQLGRATSPT